MVHLKHVHIYHGKYPTRDFFPFNLEILNRTRAIPFDTAVTFFVGENGTGKSTLLQAICRKCGIPIWEGMKRRRFENNPFEDRLHEVIGLTWADGSVPGSFYGSDIFRNFSQVLDEWASADPGQLRYFGGKSLVTQSHGQSVMSYFRARYRIRGLYFLDEPETALSPKSQLELLEVLEGSGKGEAQFIIATHSPILLACPGARIYSFDHATVREVPYEETDHFRTYRDFMTKRSKYLR